MGNLKECVQAEFIFKGKTYQVLMLFHHDKMIRLELEDSESMEDWSGEFDVNYVEELTRKTGNFKHFDVFASMLQAVLVESTPGLTLELMSYSDLEDLRRQKMPGSTTAHSTLTNSSRLSQSQQNKRYLILTYTTQFDRIYYPLPLQYHGRPSTQQLKQQMRQLRLELANIRQGDSSDWRKLEINELKSTIRSLREENCALQNEISSLRQQLAANTQVEQYSHNLLQELSALRSIVSSLEEELTEERARSQHANQKKSRQTYSLQGELEEARAQERAMRLRVKTLTNELAFFKRRPVHKPPLARLMNNHNANLDVEVTGRRVGRSLSARQSAIASPRSSQDSASGRNSIAASKRSRPSSVDNMPYSPDKSRHRSRSWDTQRSTGRKFDPTDYVRQQEIKREEARKKQQREIRSRQRLGSTGDSGSERDSWLGLTGKKSQARDRSVSPASLLSDRGGASIPLGLKKPIATLSSRRSPSPATRHTFRRVPRENSSVESMPLAGDGYSSVDEDQLSTASLIRVGPSGQRSLFRKPRVLNDNVNNGGSQLRGMSSKNSHASNYNNNSRSRGSRTPARGGRPTVINAVNLDSQYMEIDDIDRRLDKLQNFFDKYLET